MQPTALITGITGQDGAYLAEFLLNKGYVVHGVRLYEATPNLQRLDGLLRKYPTSFHLHYGDMTDGGNLTRLIAQTVPQEIYNLAGLSHVKVSFDVPEAAADINALGALRLLEAIRTLGLQDKTRFYQASSSEMFGNAPAPQNEQTPLQPCSPYAAAKLYAYHMVRIYRESYGLHASNGILFNHESPLRGEEFVTQKIALAVAAIVDGRQEALTLGNLDSLRDWGHARDYVEGMWLMLQRDKPDDYVLATGKSRSVRDFVTAAFACAGINILWRGEGIGEKGLCAKSERVLVNVDPQLFRPAEVHALRGDATKAAYALGWKPRTEFSALVNDMVSAALTELNSAGEGHHALRAAE